MSKAVMQQALEALEGLADYRYTDRVKNTMASLRQALAEPEQEPVCDKDPRGCWNVRCQLGKVCKNIAPTPRKWVGLTDEEILAEMPVTEHSPITSFARAIEAKLKEKNT